VLSLIAVTSQAIFTNDDQSIESTAQTLIKTYSWHHVVDSVIWRKTWNRLIE